MHIFDDKKDDSKLTFNTVNRQGFFSIKGLRIQNQSLLTAIGKWSISIMFSMMKNNFIYFMANKNQL